MSAHLSRFALPALAAFLAASSPAWAAAFFFTTGSPDGSVATASRPASGAVTEVETADDFVVSEETLLSGGTFTGLLPSGTTVASLQNVVIEIYRIFPQDSTTPPSGRSPTRVNSPSDNALVSRSLAGGDLTVAAATLGSFTAANSVINGIFPVPNTVTGGEGPVSGTETRISFDFTNPLDVPAGHYFFVPQVQLSSGNFLWLSATRNPSSSDLQTWIRNGSLAPDWLRVGTDILGRGTFNASFSLNGSTVPEPASWTMLLSGFFIIGLGLRCARNLPAKRPHQAIR